MQPFLKPNHTFYTGRSLFHCEHFIISDNGHTILNDAPRSLRPPSVGRIQIDKSLSETIHLFTVHCLRLLSIDSFLVGLHPTQRIGKSILPVKRIQIGICVTNSHMHRLRLLLAVSGAGRFLDRPLSTHEWQNILQITNPIMGFLQNSLVHVEVFLGHILGVEAFNAMSCHP